MGFLSNRKIRKMTDPVQGTLQVTGIDGAPNRSATYQTTSLAGVLEAPGLPATAIRLGVLIVPTAKWPAPGQRLPVTADRADSSRVVIRWDEVLTAMDAAMAQAQAEELRQRTGIDPAVLSRAESEPAGVTPADADSGPSGWAIPPAATVTATGTVVGVRDVPLPAGFGPAGGIADLDIALSDGSGTRTGRVSFASPEQRARTAVSGAAVSLLIDSANPGNVTVLLPG